MSEFIYVLQNSEFTKDRLTNVRFDEALAPYK